MKVGIILGIYFFILSIFGCSVCAKKKESMHSISPNKDVMILEHMDPGQFIVVQMTLERFNVLYNLEKHTITDSQIIKEVRGLLDSLPKSHSPKESVDIRMKIRFLGNKHEHEEVVYVGFYDIEYGGQVFSITPKLRALFAELTGFETWITFLPVIDTVSD